MDIKVYIDTWLVELKSSCGINTISCDVPIKFPEFRLPIKKGAPVGANSCLSSVAPLDGKEDTF
jgi:hypothetical protein